MEEGYTYKYWRPAVTVDNVVFSFDGTHLNTLLIRRKNEPFKDYWAFPGGFLNEDETLEMAAQRELKEETGLTSMHYTEIGSFSDIDRDPRGRTISIAFASVVRPTNTKVTAADDASSTRWFPVTEMPILAFDHEKIFRMALWKLRIGFLNAPVAFILMNDIFTLPEMQRLHTDVFGQVFDRRNFQKKYIKSGILSPVASDNEIKKNVHAPTQYRFNENSYMSFLKKSRKM